MWKLDKKTNSYSTKGTLWTWGKVSAEVLRYMRKKDNNIPTFVPLVSKDTTLTNMSPETIRYGRKLYVMTRTIYDTLKKDPTLNITSLLDKSYSKETRSNKHKFGELELETEHIHHKQHEHHHNHHNNDTNIHLEKQIQRLEHRLNEHDVQKVLIDKLKDCMRQIETLRRNVRKMIYGRMKHHENTLKEQYEKVVEWEAIHGKKGEAISDPWNNASIHGWSQPTPLPTMTNAQSFEIQTPQVVSTTYDVFASPLGIVSPTLPATALTSTMTPVSVAELFPTTVSPTTSTSTDALLASERKKETDILKNLFAQEELKAFSMESVLKDESKVEGDLLERNLDEATSEAKTTEHKEEHKEAHKPDHMAEHTAESKAESKAEVKFGIGESSKPKLTLNLPPVVLNGKEEGNTNSVLTYLYNLLQNVVPQNKGSNDTNVQTNEEIIGECSLNANLLELQKTKAQDHRCCMINVNVPIMPQHQPNCNNTKTEKPSSPINEGNAFDIRNKSVFHHHGDSHKNGFEFKKSMDTCFGHESDEAYGFTNSAAFFDDISTTCVKK